MIKKVYKYISLIFFIAVIIILTIIDKTNSVNLSLVIETIFILYTLRISWGCILYVKEQYQKRKYSYAIIMNLGLALFLIINAIRQICLIIVNLNKTTVNDIYENTLGSFSYFAILVLPLIVIMAGYSVVTNIILIKKEGLRYYNVLGIGFGIIILLGIVASQMVYGFLNNAELLNTQIYIKKFIDIGINSVLCYFYCLTIATLYCNIMAARHEPDFDKDFVIIFGAKIKDDGTLTPIVKARVDKAIEFAKKQKEKSNKSIIFVPSGGQGSDEVMAEAEAMKNYLVQNGISENNIIIENKSTSTRQNIKFSKELIDLKQRDGNIIFSTTNYHVFRSGVIANDEGIDCEGIGSTTKWYFYTNALIREFIANLYIQRKQHFAIITILNVVLFILVLIGYKYSLLN